MMSLLNKREREVFENDYQWLSNFPGWKMENVFTLETFESRELDKFSRLIFTGKNRLSRLNIAAHEAGHAIALAATYHSVDSAAIDVKDHPLFRKPRKLFNSYRKPGAS